MLAGASSASAGQTHVAEGVFGPAEQPSFTKAASLAVQQESGDLLVVDSEAKTLRRFKPNGEPDPFTALGANTIDGKGSGGGPGSGGTCVPPSAECDETPSNGTLSSFEGNPAEVQVAVDESGAATDGNIYLTDSQVPAIDIFAASGEYIGRLTGAGGEGFGEPCGVAVDPGGNVYVGDYANDEIYKFAPAANPPVNGDGSPFSGEVEHPCTVAAGAGSSAGSIFAAEFFHNVYKLDGGVPVQINLRKSGEEETGEAANTNTLSVDPASGHLFVATDNAGTQEVDAPNAEFPSVVSRFGPSPDGVAVDGSTGRVYLSVNSGESRVQVWSGLVPLPDVSTDAASGIGETTATLNGTVKANGQLVSECFFEWGKTAAPYEHTHEPCAETPAQIGTGTSSVHADLSGLEAETVYHYRLVAKNANGTASPLGEDVSFQTVSRPELEGEWAEAVLFTETSLKAKIDPHGAATSYRFEWGPAGSPYQHAEAGSIPSAAGPRTVGVQLAGLTPGAAYHFRVVAENECHPETAPGTPCVSEGEDRAFTAYPNVSPRTDCPNQAYRSGAGALLPDCRAYEMVSPVDKNGGDIVNEVGGEAAHAAYIQSRPDGGAITYSAAQAFAGQVSAKFYNQYLARRSESAPHEGGWENAAINAPLGAQLPPPGAGWTVREIGAFSADLCQYWYADHNKTPPTPEGQAGYQNLYRRQNCEPGAGGLEALTTVAPPEGTGDLYVNQNSVQGVSADGGTVFFAAKAALTADATATKRSQVYVRRGGQIRLVSVLPNGTADVPVGSTDDEVGGGGATAAGLGKLAGSLQNATSSDGRRAYWTAHLTTTGTGKIYLRQNPAAAETTVKEGGNCVPDPVLACTIAVSAGGAATFWAATPSGSQAIYSEGGKLYRFDVAGAEAGEAPQLIAEGLIGVAGASEDLTRIYLVSTKALAGAASGGKPNLYLYEGGAFSFIGTLAAGDVDAGTGTYSVAIRKPFYHATRVSADGRHLAFESRAALTGYDNRDAANGEADIEVYKYEAGGALLCVSCNPSGARPQGRELPVSYNYPPHEGNAVPTGVWAAAWIPAWEHPLHASNLLSANGGRLFFNSNDALLPRDANGAQDVYEWEAPGEGECREDEEDPNYFASNGGCIYLISSGQNPHEAEFWEASADGGDVFFTTEASLVPQDPGSIDLYDARVEGGFAAPAEAAECAGEACQGTQEAPAQQTRSSSAYRGPGNVPARRDCRTSARRAAKLSRRAKRLRRQAKRSHNPRAGKRMRRKARRLAHRARRQSGNAKRCRRANRRAGR